MYSVFLSLLILSVLADFSHGFAYEYTFLVEAGDMQCFYQQIDVMNVVLEVEFQVLEGADMDINFYLKSPDSRFLRTDQRKKSQSHEINVQQMGTYEFCFDNRYSRMTGKLVFFEVYCETEDRTFTNAEVAAKESASQNAAMNIASEMMEITVDEFKTKLTNVKHSVEKMKNIQGIIRAHMRKDRSIQEDNFSRVNQFSGLYMFVMVSVSLVQVLMIRGLFETPKSKTAQTMKAST